MEKCHHRLLPPITNWNRNCSAAIRISGNWGTWSQLARNEQGQHRLRNDALHREDAPSLVAGDVFPVPDKKPFPLVGPDPAFVDFKEAPSLVLREIAAIPLVYSPSLVLRDIATVPLVDTAPLVLRDVTPVPFVERAPLVGSGSLHRTRPREGGREAESSAREETGWKGWRIHRWRIIAGGRAVRPGHDRQVRRAGMKAGDQRLESARVSLP